MDAGSRETTRRVSARATGFAFAVTYLLAQLGGADPGTALQRGCVVAACSLLLGGALCRPVVDVVLDALARDEARRAAERSKQENA